MPLAIEFGDRITSFMLQDCVSLGINPSTIKSTPRLKSSPSRDTTTTILNPSLALKSRLVSSADALATANLALKEAKAIRGNGAVFPTSKVFRFADLPTEIRLMIYEYVFLIYNKCKSNSRLKFLHVLQKDKKLYAEAFKVFCATYRFPIPLGRKERSEKRIHNSVEGLQEEDMKLVKRVLLAVPRYFQHTTPYDGIIIQRAKVLELTLSVLTPNSLRVVAYSVIPTFKHIHTLTVILRNERTIIDKVAHWNSFRDVWKAIDRVLGVEGQSIGNSVVGKNCEGEKSRKAKTKHMWRWEAKKIKEAKEERKFEMNVVKKHIKFD